MALSLGAKPVVVAREVGAGLSARWQWLIDDVGAFRMALNDGAVGTAQRRDSDGTWVLLAWNVAMQRQAAERAAAEREMRKPLLLYTASTGAAPRVYRQAARPVAMPTHAPYAYEPAHW